MINPAPYYNDPQLKILLSTKPHKTFIGGRGVGKTTIIAEIIKYFIAMPGEKFPSMDLPTFISAPNPCRRSLTISSAGVYIVASIISLGIKRRRNFYGMNLSSRHWIIPTASSLSMDLSLNSTLLIARKWPGAVHTMV